MKRLTAVAVIATGILLATAIPAAAKGADEARITGPGLSKPIVVTGEGHPGRSGNLSWLSGATGFFDALVANATPVVGGTTSGPKPLKTTPNAPLGPRYVVSYRVPALQPNGADGFVRQDIYPYAAGGPVIYTPAGQQVYNDKATVAGWACGGSDLLALLNTLGVPKTAARPAPRFDVITAPNLTVVTVVLALMLILVGVLLWMRRRPHHA